ncbi:hypothetical protein P886_1751 [Alteromonadaceae bacterium 2753L.S.0a.02]|nr:hypothetical protein P886_1751 [Alteromonadaceae bacterium 2753L.S.0a.02]
MKLILSFIIAILFPLTSYANQWVFGKVQIVEEYGQYGANQYQVLLTLTDQIWTSGSSSNGATNCTDRFRIMTGEEGVTEEIKNRMYTMMLAAYMSNKKIGLYMNTEKGPGCTVQVTRVGDGF